MNKIETKILNCSAVREAEKNMVFAARLTQRGHMIHSMDDLVNGNQTFPCRPKPPALPAGKHRSDV